MSGVNFLTSFLTGAILTIVLSYYAKRWGLRLGEWSADRYGEQIAIALADWMDRHPHNRITIWLTNYFIKHYGTDSEAS